MGKRWVAWALSVGLMATLASGAAAWEDKTELDVPEAGQALPAVTITLEETDRNRDEPAATLAEPDWEGAIQALRTGIVARETSISLKGLNIPVPADQEMKDLNRMFHDLRYRYGELFAFSGGVNFSTSGGMLTTCKPTYTMEAGEYAKARDFYRRELEAIVAQVPRGLSDMEKVLFVHDYLAAHYEYDQSFTNYDVYSFLRDGKGTCQAYMLVFSDLMRELKVPVSYVSSDCINHTWNMVQLDGKWYHVDVTWDDPSIVVTDAQGNKSSVDLVGVASHSNFLISDAKRKAQCQEHAQKYDELTYADDWVRGVDALCGDDRYETDAWPFADADSSMVYVAGEESWYYISTDLSDRGLYRWSREEGKGVYVAEYSPNTSGGTVPLVEYQGSLYFTDLFRIARYELATQTKENLLEMDSSVRLGGMRIVDGTLYYKTRGDREMTALEREILPYHPVEGAPVSYYYNFGAVDVQVDKDGRAEMLLAWYDPATGAMKKLSQIREDGTYGVAVEDKDLRCTLFCLSDDGTFAPLRAKLGLSPEREEKS